MKNKKYKLKTNKAVKKRFKITKNGKVLCTGAKKRHMLTDRTPKNKRQARGWKEVDPSDKRGIMMALPYDH